MNPFDGLIAEVNELVASFKPQVILGTPDGVGMTQYLFFFALAIFVVAVLFLCFKKLQAKSLLPDGRFVNGMEIFVEFIRDDMCRSVLGNTWRKHFPFVASVFVVILVNNLIGILPGMKPGTGTISSTAAMALVSFVYFVAFGVKKHGGIGYLKSLAPKGVMFPLNVVVWLIEVITTAIRLVTLAVRLFCNLFAGHIVLGTFAIMTSLFFIPITHAISFSSAAFAGGSLIWLAVLFGLYLVEIMTAAIQAYVFALLSAVYVQIAESDEH